MKRNYWVLGSRTIMGEAGSVKAAGDVKMPKTQILEIARWQAR
jgi:hypothetical protein